MKKILLIATILIGMTTQAQHANPNSINVTGEGVVTVVPDGAIVTVRVENQGSEALDVKNANDKAVSTVIKYCKDAGIKEKDVRTEYVNLNKNYNYNTKKYNYTANQTMRIKIRKLGDYDKIMGGLLASGINRIDGVQFTSSKIESLEIEARKKAVANAKRKAEEYTSVLGQSIGKALQINEQNSVSRPMPMRGKMMAMSAQAESSGPTIAPGELTIRTEIHIIFELK